jgi:protein-S-isoprenylcysteine O-methyltransferase Ste14
LVGLIFIIFGLILLLTTIRLFVKVGRGTLAPWDPPENLVVQGPYRFVRNPMISSVFFILLGEGVLFGSVIIFAFAISFLLFNHLYFIFSKEPGLISRFGQEYQIYRQKVPRWIPRISPYHPGNSDED